MKDPLSSHLPTSHTKVILADILSDVSLLLSRLEDLVLLVVFGRDIYFSIFSYLFSSKQSISLFKEIINEQLSLVLQDNASKCHYGN